MNKPDMRKVKCPDCGATLFFAKAADIEIKCPRCKAIIHYEISDTSAKHTVKPRK